MRDVQPPQSTEYPVTIPARDGYALSGTVYHAHRPSGSVAVVNAAIAVPQRFYRHFAAGLAEAGITTLTYDYRGIGASRPQRLRGFAASARDWALLDMAGVLDWVTAELGPERLFFVGHSLGGQVAGLLDNSSLISGMATMSAQSGHWRLQGGEQRLVVLMHTWVTLPLLSRLFGYMPWGLLGSGEDLPKDAALEWAGWCRNRRYILGDPTLPLDRYQKFTSPVLAYSFGDDKWGTARSVDALMGAYPNLERRHLEPEDVGLDAIGHVGYFRPASRRLWLDLVDWFDLVCG